MKNQIYVRIRIHLLHQLFIKRIVPLTIHNQNLGLIGRKMLNHFRYLENLHSLTGKTQHITPVIILKNYFLHNFREIAVTRVFQLDLLFHFHLITIVHISKHQQNRGCCHDQHHEFQRVFLNICHEGKRLLLLCIFIDIAFQLTGINGTDTLIQNCRKCVLTAVDNTHAVFHRGGIRLGINNVMREIIPVLIEGCSIAVRIRVITYALIDCTQCFLDGIIIDCIFCILILFCHIPLVDCGLFLFQCRYIDIIPCDKHTLRFQIWCTQQQGTVTHQIIIILYVQYDIRFFICNFLCKIIIAVGIYIPASSPPFC